MELVDDDPDGEPEDEARHHGLREERRDPAHSQQAEREVDEGRSRARAPRHRWRPRPFRAQPSRSVVRRRPPRPRRPSRSARRSGASTCRTAGTRAAPRTPCRGRTGRGRRRSSRTPGSAERGAPRQRAPPRRRATASGARTREANRGSERTSARGCRRLPSAALTGSARRTWRRSHGSGPAPVRSNDRVGHGTTVPADWRRSERRLDRVADDRAPERLSGLGDQDGPGRGEAHGRVVLRTSVGLGDRRPLAGLRRRKRGVRPGTHEARLAHAPGTVLTHEAGTTDRDPLRGDGRPRVGNNGGRGAGRPGRRPRARAG